MMSRMRNQEVTPNVGILNVVDVFVFAVKLTIISQARVGFDGIKCAI